MGVFRYPLEIGDPEGNTFERIDALVDTGASFTVAPASVLRRLGVAPQERIRLRLADGNIIERDIGETKVRLDGRSVTTLVVFGEEDVPALLGAYTLEGSRMVVDPANQRLVPQDIFYLMLNQ